MALNSTLWTAIQTAAPGLFPDKDFDAYVTHDFGWIIGPYNELCDLAHEIAPGGKTWTKFKGHGARLGRRGDDIPPFVVGHVPGFRKKIKGKDPLIVPQKVRNQREDPAQRTTGTRQDDQFPEAADYFEKKGLEAHHIVEKSILGKLGLNSDIAKNDFADVRAPCVLVMAQLHRRKFTPGVGSARDDYSSGMKGSAAKKKLTTLFGGLYDGMNELDAIAKVIIAEVGNRKAG